MRSRVLAVIVMLGIATYWNSIPAAPEPAPSPEPPAAIDLRGAFSTEDAAEDSQLLAALCDEVACAIEYDGSRAEPSMTTATAFDALRTRSREFLCTGKSIGDKHPRVRQIVGEYLDKQLGNSGGDVSPEQRMAWVNAYRTIARSARAASKP